MNALTRCGRSLLGLAFLAACFACSDGASNQPTVPVEARDHRFTVQARGELVASEAVDIRVPDGLNMGFDIAWIVPEYSEVEKGQVIVRFDDSDVRTSRENIVVEVASRDLQLGVHTQDSAIARILIDHERDRVAGEQDIARTFTDVDEPLLFSRNEILDALGDLNLLEVQDAYFAWAADTHERRTTAELHRLVAFRDNSKSQLDKQESALAVMELTSPADGTFVYARTPWGEKLTKGQRVFPGRSVGLLPVKGKVRARIFVPEVDAVGLKEGQEVTLRLDSDVERAFGGRVSNVSSVAIPRNRDNPQKYFVVEAEPDQVDAELMRVGSSLHAAITTGSVENGFLLPQQAVFYDQDQPFVYVVERNTMARREVSLGQVSPTLVEVVAGLEAGDEVGVSAPDGSTE
ncbi:MAG: HlyD family efflux transporter periplasmic adaptor subunit [Gammaproteobacteria bacterium]|nr:HlyD family efflux transporter periplasmic adaptor subunit [Gammaproteobacteria bacterium]